MSVVEILKCRNLSVKTVFQLECTCQGSRMRRGQKAGKEHAQYGKENTKGRRIIVSPPVMAYFPPAPSVDWVGRHVQANAL